MVSTSGDTHRAVPQARSISITQEAFLMPLPQGRFVLPACGRHVNEIRQQAPLCLVSFAQYKIFESRPCCVCISSLFVYLFVFLSLASVLLNGCVISS